MRKLSSALVAAVALGVTGLTAAPSYADPDAQQSVPTAQPDTVVPAPASDEAPDTPAPASGADKGKPASFPGGGASTNSEHGSW
jgi:hypothetical protein